MAYKYQDLISKMTLEEKARILSGKNTWETVDYKAYGIPSVFLSDGPHGLRKQTGKGDQMGMNASLPATCFPTAATVANSWDEAFALGEEAVCQDIHMILGPGLNIKRSPMCGRNFEYFSEDPYLAGKMAAAYIRGIQKHGIAACPKHFAANSQETRRMAMDSIIDERTFREIYTGGFEIAVKEGKAKAIMTAYNEINGVYANENNHLLNDILRKEWGFDGIVVSDWGASNDHALGVKEGSQLEMPGTGKSGVLDILHGVRDGVLTEDEIDRRVDEILTFVFDVLPATQNKTSDTFDVQAHHALARRAAEESIVLLKNEQAILPLAQGAEVVVIGDFAEHPRYQGAGSSLVHPTVTPESFLSVCKDPEAETSSDKDAADGALLRIASYVQGYKRNQKTDPKLIAEAVEASRIAKEKGQLKWPSVMKPRRIKRLTSCVSWFSK